MEATQKYQSQCKGKEKDKATTVVRSRDQHITIVSDTSLKSLFLLDTKSLCSQYLYINFQTDANGSGWWDCDMEGVDSEEVGHSEVWEGVGSTTYGDIVDWH